MPIERTQKMILAIVVGIALFCVELSSGVFSAITLNIGGSIMILIIIGMIAGRPKDGMASAVVTLILMLPIGMMLWPFLDLPLQYPDYPIVALWTLIGILVWRSLVLDVSGDGEIILMQLSFIFIAPILYAFGFLIAGLGGNLGSSFWSLFEKKYPGRGPVSTSEDYPASSDGWD